MPKPTDIFDPMREGNAFDQHNLHQRIRREAYEDCLKHQGHAVPQERARAAASRYPLRKRVPKVIDDPLGYSQWSVSAGDALFWRHNDAGAWFEEGPQLTVLRVRAIAALLDDPWTWEEEDTSVEEVSDG